VSPRESTTTGEPRGTDASGRTGLARKELAAMLAEYHDTRDPELRERVIEAHLGLAHYLARRFSHRGLPEDDLAQVASLALVKAVDRFDPSHGFEFSTFATHTINGELKRHFRDHGWSVRAPRRLQELYLEVSRCVDDLAQELGRAPQVHEVATKLNLAEEDVIEALEAGHAYRIGSLDGSGDGGDDDPSPVPLGETDPNFERAELHADLASLLERLPERQRRIVWLRFWGGLTQSEIARQLGLSQMHVSRLLARSLDMLRRSADGELRPKAPSKPVR
jgi:RNA polymerase sigma-B factor